jgi:hypothetical protein
VATAANTYVFAACRLLGYRDSNLTVSVQVVDNLFPHVTNYLATFSNPRHTFLSETLRLYPSSKRKSTLCGCFFYSLGYRDSNPDTQDQNLMSYH